MWYLCIPNTVSKGVALVEELGSVSQTQACKRSLLTSTCLSHLVVTGMYFVYDILVLKMLFRLSTCEHGSVVRFSYPSLVTSFPISDPNRGSVSSKSSLSVFTHCPINNVDYKIQMELTDGDTITWRFMRSGGLL